MRVVIRGASSACCRVDGEVVGRLPSLGLVLLNHSRSVPSGL